MNMITGAGQATPGCEPARTDGAAAYLKRIADALDRQMLPDVVIDRLHGRGR